MKIVILVTMLFLIGALFIVSEKNLHLKDEGARQEFNELYLAWVSQLFENSGNIVSYVVKLDWLPENK